MIEHPKTLRELYQMIEQDDPRFLDVPLSVVVRDGNLHVASANLPNSLWDCPRSMNQPGAFLSIEFNLNDKFSLRKKPEKK